MGEGWGWGGGEGAAGMLGRGGVKAAAAGVSKRPVTAALQEAYRTLLLSLVAACRGDRLMRLMAASRLSAIGRKWQSMMAVRDLVQLRNLIA